MPLKDLPVDSIMKNVPLDMSSVEHFNIKHPIRARDEAYSTTLFADGDVSDNATAIEGGDETRVAAARTAIQPPSITQVIDDSRMEGMDPETTVQRVSDEQEKLSDWGRLGTNFYLEQAVALGDTQITADTVRFATNVQMGSELMQQALDEAREDTSTAGYIGNFIDRYLIRQLPIGAVEMLTGRPEREGQDLINAATTLPPDEYKAYIENYISRIKAEGFLAKDNVFAIMDAMLAFETSGYDRHKTSTAVMGALDLFPAATAVVRGVGVGSRVLKSSTTLSRIGALKGVKAADDAAEVILTKSSKNPPAEVLNDTLPDMVRIGPPAPVRTNAGRGAAMMQDNLIIRQAERGNASGFLGRQVDSPVVQRAYKGQLEVLRAYANNPITNVTAPLVMDNLGNARMSLQLGTPRSGAPYRTFDQAAKAARKIKEGFPTAKVVFANGQDATDGHYVSVEKILDVSDGVEAMKTGELYDFVRTTMARYLGSKASTEADGYNTLASMAEGAASVLGQASKPYVKALKRVKSKDRRILSSIFSDLRDGGDSAYREMYTLDEFAVKYKAASGGIAPSQETYDAFKAAVSLNDASWLFRANIRLQKYLAKDFYAVDIELAGRKPARVVENAPSGATILNATDGTLITKLKKGEKIWELDTELEGGIRYIARPKSVKPLSHDDVLGYNAGGRRLNPNANYFVTFGDRRVGLAAFSEKEAQLAVEQMNNIKQAVAKGGRAEIDDVIRKNSDWNPEVQNLDDWNAYLRRRGLNAADEINFKNRDGAIKTGEELDPVSTTFGEYVMHSLRREDDVLTEFGGKEAMQYDPVGGMFGDFTSAVQQYAHNVYTQEAIGSWVKTAKMQGSGITWEGAIPSDPRRAFETAVWSEANNRVAGELMQQKAIIQSRLSMTSQLDKTMSHLGSQMQEFVFDKTSLKIGRGAGDRVQQDLLTLGFQSAFGFGSVSQFFVQGFHAMTVAAISPKYGPKGAAMGLPMQFALMADTAAQEATAIQRLAKWAGISVDEAGEMAEFVRTSGKGIIDGALAERGTSASWGFRGWKGDSPAPDAMINAFSGVKKMGSGALHVGLTPFREGERVARLTAINTAILEYKAMNAGKSILTHEARAAITRRYENLSFHMTNTNRARIQEGYGRLPTQWFSYSMRAMENVILGRDFTVAERARLAAVLFPSFGLTGLGLDFAADGIAEYVQDKTDIDMTGAGLTLVKRGMLDWAIETGTGVKIALADRLAPITLFTNLYRDVVGGDKSTLAVIMGPSGDISSSMAGALAQTVSDMWGGHTVSMTDSAIRTMRNFSGVDNVFKAWGIMQNGQLRARSGKTAPYELDAMDAVAQLMGFSPREVTEWYQRQRWQYQDDRAVKDFTTEMQQLFSHASNIINGGDYETGIQLMEEITTKIKLSGFTVAQQETMFRALKVNTSEAIMDMIIKNYENERYFTGDVIEDTFTPYGGK